MEDQTRFSDPELDDAALARYLCGESDATERQWIEQRVHLSEVAWHELTSARTAWLASGTTPQKGDIEQFVKRLRAAQAQHRSRRTDEYRLGGLTESGPSSQRYGNQRFKAQPLRRGVWYAAASLVIGVIGILVGWNGRGHRSTVHNPLTVSTYATANGERATITLVDGTTVALDVASRLDVPADYALGNHTVRLNGEAMFTVAHHDGTPFTVLAGPTTTKVLGTTFLVRRYPTDTTVTVAVRQGRVAVGPTVVTAARLVEVGRTGVVRAGVASLSQFSFATGVLTLDSMSLAAAIPELDRWYNADIRLGDPALETLQMTKGEFTAGSLSDLAEVLEWTFSLRVVRNGRVVTLLPQTR